MSGTSPERQCADAGSEEILAEVILYGYDSENMIQPEIIPLDLDIEGNVPLARNKSPTNSTNSRNIIDSSESYGETSGGSSDPTNTVMAKFEEISSNFSPRILEQILSNSEGGREVISKAKLGELSQHKSKVLVDVIAQWHLQNRSSLTSQDLRTYALSVTTLFPFEDAKKYYVPKAGGRKNNSGKIANRIGNIKQRKRRLDLQEEKHAESCKIGPPSEEKLDRLVIEANQWLELNCQPWSTVLDNWKTSFQFRKKHLRAEKCIDKIFTTYPQLKYENGYQLIDIDFQLLFPKAPNGIKRLDELRPIVIEVLSKKAVDPFTTTLQTLLVNNSTADTKLCALLLALNAILPPIAVGRRYKPTIRDAQQDTILFVPTSAQIDLQLESLYETYKDKGLPIVPKLVVVGSVTEIEGSFIVGYHKKLYHTQSAARALDIVVKLTAVHNLPYAKLSKLVWHFITDYIYQIKQLETYSAIEELKRHLTKTEGKKHD
ncbi:uncharacterized protein LOC129754079 isoform X2 [Uranotaenia lowii]|uniref:uncharacterized protein LOC129754079 isoform X2 n=1 Tax=Uranotaenia lowii TaxID=190385 RepID=UPI00247AECE3|nr:uncharacterized protein LOC129754079 isoform X2 [Uranotaenia lowii]